jgi:hypothetical protein
VRNRTDRNVHENTPYTSWAVISLKEDFIGRETRKKRRKIDKGKEERERRGRVM